MSLQDGARGGADRGGDRGERSVRARRRGFDRYAVTSFVPQVAQNGQAQVHHGMSYPFAISFKEKVTVTLDIYLSCIMQCMCTKF